jgi:hypothetical protein
MWSAVRIIANRLRTEGVSLGVLWHMSDMWMQPGQRETVLRRMYVRSGVSVHISDMWDAVRIRANCLMADMCQIGCFSAHLRYVACSQDQGEHGDGGIYRLGIPLNMSDMWRAAGMVANEVMAVESQFGRSTTHLRYVGCSQE